MVISCSVLLRMRNLPGQSCGENHNTHFMFNNALSEYGAVMRCGKMWYRQPERPQMRTERMRFERWITKATNTNSHYATLIAFPQ